MSQRPSTFRPPCQPAGRRAACRQYDRDRGSARKRSYDAKWDRVSRDWRRAHPKCLGCEAVCWLISADVTDHIVPRRENRSLFWDEADLQSACAWHHDTVKQRLEARHRSGAIDASALRLDSAGAIALDRR